MKNLLFALFGATGDLSYRKLIPALYNLHRRGVLKDSSTILAIGRRDWTREQYIEEVRPWVKEFARLDFTDEAFAEFSHHIQYHPMQFTQREDYLGLYSVLDRYSQGALHDTHFMFYYAVAPSFFEVITEGLTETGCIQGQTSVIVEKPFGDDLENAKNLADRLADAYGEENIFHIDHYLGKEMVQNISTLRFRNEIFRGAWNQRHIDNVQISAFEEVGMEGRGAYYESSGALKDMVQNHLFQVFSIFAMEEPADLADDHAIHRAQTRVIEDLSPIGSDNLADSLTLAQYEGFHDEEDIPADSTTETYAALRLEIKNERWRGVPFYVRTGKKLDRRETVVVVSFRKTHPEDPGNRLVFRIQPEEGVSLIFNIRKSGHSHETEEVSMDFLQKSRPAWQNSPEAYERLLQAAYEGERGLFSPWSMITASWSRVNEMIEVWEAAGKPMATYKAGSAGPAEADRMLEARGQHWIDTHIFNGEEDNS